jgi:hypothetical protein
MVKARNSRLPALNEIGQLDGLFWPGSRGFSRRRARQSAWRGRRAFGPGLGLEALAHGTTIWICRRAWAGGGGRAVDRPPCRGAGRTRQGDGISEIRLIFHRPPRGRAGGDPGSARVSPGKPRSRLVATARRWCSACGEKKPRLVLFRDSFAHISCKTASRCGWVDHQKVVDPARGSSAISVRDRFQGAGSGASKHVSVNEAGFIS